VQKREAMEQIEYKERRTWENVRVLLEVVQMPLGTDGTYAWRCGARVLRLRKQLLRR
jgi:hypothetical protein